MLKKLRLIAMLTFVLILMGFCRSQAQLCGELSVQDIRIYPAEPCPEDSVQVEALITFASNVLPCTVDMEYYLNDIYLVKKQLIPIDRWIAYPGCPQDSCPPDSCGIQIPPPIDLEIPGKCELLSLFGCIPEWQCLCHITIWIDPPSFWLGDYTVGDTFTLTVKIDPDDEFLETDETNNEVTEEFVTCGAIPTLTEWGLIIFGVVLIGFITYVFLRRRKVIGVRT